MEIESCSDFKSQELTEKIFSGGNLKKYGQSEKSQKMHQVKSGKKMPFSFMWGQNKRQVRTRQQHNRSTHKADENWKQRDCMCVDRKYSGL